MAGDGLGRILLSWPFFFLQELGLLIFTFVQVLCGQEQKNPDANDDDVSTKPNSQTQQQLVQKWMRFYTVS